MSSLPNIVITTRLPPLLCGVGTYSWLANKFRPNDSMAARFLVMEGATEARALLGCDAIADFKGNPRILARLLDEAGTANILLHYAGRAYQRHGCPIWLPGLLRRWKESFPQGNLTVFFHEVPGEMSPLSRQFLLGKINARIIRQLAAVADVIITNTRHHAAILSKMCPREAIHCLPVGSNINPVTSSLQSRAEAEFVVFGLPFNRWQILRAFEPQIGKWKGSGLLAKLHLIGPDEGTFAARASRLTDGYSGNVIRHGLLGEKDVSSVLRQVRFALSNVTSATWGKSGTFMAYAAHGCSVITKNKENEIPLCHSIAADELGYISIGDIESRSAALKNWYEENASWPIIASRLAKLSQANGAPR